MHNSKLLGMIAAIALTACVAAAEEGGNANLPRIDSKLGEIPVVDRYSPVYPFDALLAEKDGSAKIESMVDPEGRLLSVKVMETSGPEFAGAAVAYAEAMDYGLHGMKKRPVDTFIVEQKLVFDLDECDKPIHTHTCPTESALKILKKLRKDPTGKQFARAKHLDGALVPLKQRAPVFPKALQDKAGSGEAVIDFYIDQRGFAVLPRIVSASDPAFGYAACQSIDTWSFKPPLREGKPTVVKVRIPVNFRLKPQQPETPAPAK